VDKDTRHCIANDRNARMYTLSTVRFVAPTNDCSPQQQIDAQLLTWATNPQRLVTVDLSTVWKYAELNIFLTAKT